MKKGWYPNITSLEPLEIVAEWFDTPDEARDLDGEVARKYRNARYGITKTALVQGFLEKPDGDIPCAKYCIVVPVMQPLVCTDGWEILPDQLSLGETALAVLEEDASLEDFPHHGEGPCHHPLFRSYLNIRELTVTIDALQGKNTRGDISYRWVVYSF